MTSSTQNQATSIYQRLGIHLRQQVSLKVGGIDFTFFLDAAAYDAMQNEIMPDNKITPIKDYLLAIVEPTQRAELAELLQIPGIAGSLAEKVNEALIPKIDIQVKN